MIKIPTLEEMLKAGMHFGHRTSKRHPKMEPFIFAARNGIHVIDLTSAQRMLSEALEFIKKTVAEGKVVLLVGTKQQAKNRVKLIAEETGMPYVSGKWLGGTMTNFPVIKKLIKKYNDLQQQKKEGKLEKYTKKERLEIDREIKKLEEKVGGLANLTKLPDVIFVWDIKTEQTAIMEAKKKGIPIVAVCDTNVNPTGIKYIIPANDDAAKSVKLILDLVKVAVEEGKKEPAGKTK